MSDEVDEDECSREFANLALVSFTGALTNLALELSVINGAFRPLVLLLNILVIISTIFKLSSKNVIEISYKNSVSYPKNNIHKKIICKVYSIKYHNI